jgi:hypothetical protein
MANAQILQVFQRDKRAVADFRKNPASGRRQRSELDFRP